jgi:hypothetical protein
VIGIHLHGYDVADGDVLPIDGNPVDDVAFVGGENPSDKTLFDFRRVASLTKS